MQETKEEGQVEEVMAKTIQQEYEDMVMESSETHCTKSSQP